MFITQFHDFSNTFGITFFFKDLTIFKLHDFSRFYMTVRTLHVIYLVCCGLINILFSCLDIYMNIYIYIYILYIYICVIVYIYIYCNIGIQELK